MENKVNFNEFKFRTKYEKYLHENNYYDHDKLYKLVNNSLKSSGMKSEYIYLTESLKRCHNFSGCLLKVNTYVNSLDQISKIKIFNDYICENYFKEMQEVNFAKNVYDFAKKTYPNDYEYFVRLRTGLKDAYSEKSEVEDV